MRSKPPIPVNSSLLVDIKTTQDHNLIQSLTRTLDRQSLKFLHEAQNTPHTAAARLSSQLKAEQSDLSVPQLHSLLSYQSLPGVMQKLCIFPVSISLPQLVHHFVWRQRITLATLRTTYAVQSRTIYLSCKHKISPTMTVSYPYTSPALPPGPF